MFNVEKRIQYHKNAIKKLEEYRPNYSVEYLKIGLLICLAISILSLNYPA